MLSKIHHFAGHPAHLNPTPIFSYPVSGIQKWDWWWCEIESTREEKTRKTWRRGRRQEVFSLSPYPLPCRGGSSGRVQGVTPPPPWDDLRFSNSTGILQKKKKKTCIRHWGRFVLSCEVCFQKVMLPTLPRSHPYSAPSTSLCAVPTI